MDTLRVYKCERIYMQNRQVTIGYHIERCQQIPIKEVLHAPAGQLGDRWRNPPKTQRFQQFGNKIVAKVYQ